MHTRLVYHSSATNRAQTEARTREIDLPDDDHGIFKASKHSFLNGNIGLDFSHKYDSDDNEGDGRTPPMFNEEVDDHVGSTMMCTLANSATLANKLGASKLYNTCFDMKQAWCKDADLPIRAISSLCTAHS